MPGNTNYEPNTRFEDQDDDDDDDDRLNFFQW